MNPYSPKRPPGPHYPQPEQAQHSHPQQPAYLPQPSYPQQQQQGYDQQPPPQQPNGQQLGYPQQQQFYPQQQGAYPQQQQGYSQQQPYPQQQSAPYAQAQPTPMPGASGAPTFQTSTQLLRYSTKKMVITIAGFTFLLVAAYFVISMMPGDDRAAAWSGLRWPAGAVYLFLIARAMIPKRTPATISVDARGVWTTAGWLAQRADIKVCQAFRGYGDQTLHGQSFMGRPFTVEIKTSTDQFFICMQDEREASYLFAALQIPFVWAKHQPG